MENILHQPPPPATERPRLSLSTTIDDLPDEIVTHILSFLPLKYAFRTTILSKRWVPLCHSLSVLDFHDNNVENADDFHRLINAVMISPHNHHLPLKSFYLKCYHSKQTTGFSFHKWVEAAKQRCVKDLRLMLGLGFPPLPPTIFSSCKTLVVLHLWSLRLATMTDCSVHLPLLKTLDLMNVRFDDIEDLNKLIYGCPILENLTISYVKAASSSSVTVGIGYSKPLSKLIKASIHLFEVPLRAVSNVQHLSLFEMGKTDPIEEINSYYTGIPVFENLTVLRLYWFFHVLFDWDDVMKMLQSCPKLQDITISKCTSDFKTKVDWKYPYHVPECVSSHLTTCNILHYQDVEPDFRFARYVFQNARLLQDMKIYPISYRPKHELYEDLSSCPRISPTCKLSLI